MVPAARPAWRSLARPRAGAGLAEAWRRPPARPPARAGAGGAGRRAPGRGLSLPGPRLHPRRAPASLRRQPVHGVPRGSRGRGCRTGGRELGGAAAAAAAGSPTRALTLLLFLLLLLLFLLPSPSSPLSQALSRRRQLRRQSPGPQRPPTPHSRAPTLPPPSPGEGLLIYLFCWDLGGGLGWRGRGCPRALPPVAGATLGAAAAPASASGLQNCFQTASAGGPGVAAANQRAASILAVNSPQRSRLLPTQPWKIWRSGRSRQCHESVTYKKALGWRRDSVPGAPVRTLPPCLDSGSRPRLALTVLPPSCQVTVMLWVWRHIWRTSAKLIPGVGVRWRVYGRAASQLLIQAAHELVSIIVVIIAGSGCREQGWAGGQLLPSSGSTWRGLRAKGTTGFPGAESQHCSSCSPTPPPPPSFRVPREAPQPFGGSSLRQPEGR
ncbi:uncharacterized protein ACIGJ3_019194 [Trichechus inunguis]